VALHVLIGIVPALLNPLHRRMCRIARLVDSARAHRHRVQRAAAALGTRDLCHRAMTAFNSSVKGTQDAYPNPSPGTASKFDAHTTGNIAII